MKKQLLALVSLASLFVLNGCNGIGDKDSLLARIDGEKVFQEDYAMLLKNGGMHKISKSQFLYEKLYSKAALSAKALSEYPELAEEWEANYADIETRILTLIYQRYYAMECMTSGDAELRQFYDTNREMFPSDSTGDFLMVREDVASYYYAFKNQARFDSYVKDTLKLENPTDESLKDAKKRFAAAYRRELRNELSNNILEKTHIGIQGAPATNAKAYYKAHKDRFMTVPGYELYHVQGKDSASLVKALPENPSFDQFKAAAVKVSTNAKTAKDSG